MGLFLVVIGITGCATHPSRLPTQWWRDQALNRRVKAALAASSVKRFPNVHVSTFDQVVRLNGYVNSAQEQQAAVAVARRVPKVRDVMDYLKVGTPPMVQQTMAIRKPEYFHIDR